MLSMIINWMNQLNDEFVRVCFLLGNACGLLGRFIPCVLKGLLSLIIQYWNGDLLNINWSAAYSICRAACIFNCVH